MKENTRTWGAMLTVALLGSAIAMAAGLPSEPESSTPIAATTDPAAGTMKPGYRASRGPVQKIGDPPGQILQYHLLADAASQTLDDPARRPGCGQESSVVLRSTSDSCRACVAGCRAEFRQCMQGECSYIVDVDEYIECVDACANSLDWCIEVACGPECE